MIFSVGDKLSRWLSHFTFMNFVLGALFMVKSYPKENDNEIGDNKKDFEISALKSSPSTLTD